MKNYKSIKEIIVENYKLSGNQLPPLDKLTETIKENFPNSKWQKTHYDWYKSQIKRGKLKIEELPEEDNIENEIDSSVIDFSVSLEKDLHRYLSNKIEEIEKGLVIVDGGVEYGTDAGFIDILAKDSNNNYVVIEIKAGKAKDAALGQILGYIGAIMEEKPDKNVRGIIVASDFDNRLTFGAKAIPNIKLVKYCLNFNFEYLA